MRENRTYGSEGGEPGNRASLPLSILRHLKDDGSDAKLMGYTLVAQEKANEVQVRVCELLLDQTGQVFLPRRGVVSKKTAEGASWTGPIHRR